MEERSFLDFIGANLIGILGYGLLLCLVVRLVISIFTYDSAMRQLKGSVSVLVFFILSIVYVISPVDLIPDILLVVGWIDDALLLLGSIAFAGEAAKKIFWGDLPKEERFGTFLKWYFYCTMVCLGIGLLIFYL